MEEELNYATVTFKPNGVFRDAKPKDVENIYDEVKLGQQQWDTNPIIPEARKKVPLCTLLHLVAAALGIVCFLLMLVIVALSFHFKTVTSEQFRENINLTAQIQQLLKENTELERRTDELTGENDRLNWTIGVILDYENFPVNTYCPQKVCKPCQDGWVQFQSSCYQFFEYNYYSHWRSWEGSRQNCREMRADLVVIESQREQEFINNQTKAYNTEQHGYWIGLSKDVDDVWTWVDGSNVNKTFWRTHGVSYSKSCALTLPLAPPLANWNKVSCDMRNRWICETKALIRD